MKYLLDTHSFIWFVEGNSSLSRDAQMIIEDTANEILLSIASVWEMAIKVSLGKLQLSQPFDLFITNQVTLNQITMLDITINHTLLVATLPFHHRDPFDRLIIAQSLVESISLVSVDGVFDSYGVHRVW